jgi:hypothetical protein
MDGKWTDGCTNSNQSDKYFTLITPPGWAFAIWGLIFLWEAVGCIVAFVPQWQENFSGLIVDNTFVVFWGLACLTQSAWPFVFCGAIKVSWAVLLMVWVSLVALQQTSLSKLANLNSEVSIKTKAAAYLLLVAPFSLHLGWVTAAAALNINLSTVASLATPNTLTATALCSIVGVIASGWTLGVTGLPWTKNSACDPVMAAGVLWAVNAVSQHDTTKPITVAGPSTKLFPDSITTPVSNTCSFAVYFLAAGLVLRLAIESIVAVKRHFWPKKKEEDVKPSFECEECGDNVETTTLATPLTTPLAPQTV